VFLGAVGGDDGDSFACGMDASITDNELVEAVDTARRGINHIDTFTMDTWDRILPTLVQAHALCGGLARTLIRRLCRHLHRPPHPR
jgi:hypothetical protein